MVADPTRCDVNRLRSLLDDRLDELEIEVLTRHLDGCERCRLSLEQLAAGSRWWGDARLLAPDATTSGGAETELVQAALMAILGPPAGEGQLGTLGPYEVVEVIGRGGMGLVLKAVDRPLNRFVAIKVLAPELATSATARRRFAREAKAAAAISHEHIVMIYAVDATAGGLPFIVMQYVSGRSLQDRLNVTGPLETREILRIGMQAARGLAAAHAIGLVHRDVKPANILLENCIEQVKLTDFGLARAADDASLTQSGVVAGTPQYMAPEQARGEPTDARADLFSLGSVLYTLCTGRPPFRAETAMGVLRRVCDDIPRPIREINPEIPEWLEAIINKLQAKSPNDRFATADEVAELLGRCLAYLERPGAIPPYLPERAVALTRKPTGAWLAAAIVLVSMAALGASEVSGITRLSDFVATILRVTTSHGTLVLQVDDPEVKVRVDGEEVVVTGAGPQELRLSLSEGKHRIETSKGGLVERELVTITRGGKQTVRATLEAARSAALPPHQGERRTEQSLEEPADPTRVASSTVEALKQRIEELEGLLDGRVGDTRDIPEPAPPIDVFLPEQVASRRGYESALLAPNQPIEGSRSASLFPGPLDVMRDGREPGSRSRDLEPMPRAAYEIERPSAVFTVAISPDGKVLAYGGFDKTIQLLEVATGKSLGTLERHEQEVRALAFSPDGQTLASAGGLYYSRDLPGEVFLWDLATNRVRTELKGHTSIVWTVAFSPDGSTVATGSWDKTARLWDAKSGRPIAVLEGHTDAVRFLAFMPKNLNPTQETRPAWIPSVMGVRVRGPLMATAGFDGEVKFWDARRDTPASGRLLSSYRVNRTGLSCIAFAPNGRVLAISPRPSFNRIRPDQITLLDLESGRVYATLRGHIHAVLSLAFSPDGQMLASAGGTFSHLGDSGELIIWNFATLEPKARAIIHKYWVESIAYSPDGQTLGTGSGSRNVGGEVKVWTRPHQPSSSASLEHSSPSTHANPVKDP